MPVGCWYSGMHWQGICGRLEAHFPAASRLARRTLPMVPSKALAVLFLGIVPGAVLAQTTPDQSATGQPQAGADATPVSPEPPAPTGILPIHDYSGDLGTRRYL